MQELINFMNWVVSSIMVFSRRTTRKIEAVFYYRKCERIISEFQASEREDVDRYSVPILSFEEYPTIVELNRYLRENYGEKYPLYIESNKKDYTLVLKMIAVGDIFLEHKPGILNLNNGYGKIYTYQEYVMKNVF